MAENASIIQTATEINRKKLAPLPLNAKVSKRPHLRPAIPSPYTSSREQKVVYVSSKTPFISSVKRVEKLLDLADKRLVQSATTISKHDRQNKSRGTKRKFGRGTGAEEDEILDIAETVEALRGKKRTKVDDAKDEGYGVESVTVKGTGKAIQKVLELGLWFQQREDQYRVELRTGSVAAIDDINIDEDDEPDRADGADLEGASLGNADVQATSDPSNKAKKKMKKKRQKTQPTEPIPETRIRYTSVLELIVSLR